MIRTILLAVDASPHTAKTVAQAVDLAKLSGAVIVAMHAFKPPLQLHWHGTQMLEDRQLAVEAQAKQLLQGIAESITTAGIAVEALAVEGEPVEAILRIAAERRPDVIVVGSHGENHALGMLLGSTAERVLRDAAVSVLVVK